MKIKFSGSHNYTNADLPIGARARLSGNVVCAGKHTCISQDTLRRNRRAAAFGDILFEIGGTPTCGKIENRRAKATV